MSRHPNPDQEAVSHPSSTDGPDAATSGPILIQSLLQYLFQGVILSQGIKFWTRRADDTVSLKLYVSILVFFSILQTALETYKTWSEVIAKEHWWKSPLHWAEFLLNGVICNLCEAFLIWRCWKITGKNHWLLALLTALAFSTFAANIYLAVKIGEHIGAMTGYADPLKASYWAFPFWVYASLALALSLTFTLSIALWKTKTGLNHADKVVKHIISLTWETSTLPTICMILAVGFYCSKRVTSPRHLDLFFSLLSGKLYTLGILRTINSRAIIRERLASSDLGRTSLSEYKWNQPSSSTNNADNQPPFAPNQHMSGERPSQSSQLDSNPQISVATALGEALSDNDLSHRERRQDARSRSNSSNVMLPSFS